MLITRVCAGLAFGASVVLVAGCGSSAPAADDGASSPSPTAAATSAPTDHSRSPSPDAASKTPTSATTTPTPSTTASSSPAVADLDLSKYSLAGVLSPSKNIACLFAEHPLSVRCDLKQADWNVTAPGSCSLQYGDSVELTRGKARLSCHGDTVFGVPHQPVLAYGKTARFHDFVCLSEESGMTCHDAAGHGFSVSRGSYHLH